MSKHPAILVIVSFLTAAAFLSPSSVIAEPLQVIATSTSSGPIALTNGTRLAKLAPPKGASASVAERLNAIKPGQKVHLIVTGLRTNVQPETPYQVYLGLPPGAAASRESPSFVGTINFFNATTGGAAQEGDRTRFFSFDVTELVWALRAHNALEGDISVTLVPSTEPNNAAKPLIGEISLIAD
jgi:tyrosinase